ncbi:ribosomal protein L21 [Staphylococcus cohnii]
MNVSKIVELLDDSYALVAKFTDGKQIRVDSIETVDENTILANATHLINLSNVVRFVACSDEQHISKVSKN